MRARALSLAIAVLLSSCASSESESESTGPAEPFTHGNDLTEWVSEREIHDLLDEIADDHGGEVADDYQAVVEGLAVVDGQLIGAEPDLETQQLVYFYNPDPDVDVDTLRIEVRTGIDPWREMSDLFRDRSLPLWIESDRLPEGAEFRPLAWFGYAFRGPDSDEYVEVYVWREWNRSHRESAEYEEVHLTAGSMVLREMNWTN